LEYFVGHFGRGIIPSQEMLLQMTAKHGREKAHLPSMPEVRKVNSSVLPVEQCMGGPYGC